MQKKLMPFICHLFALNFAAVPALATPEVKPAIEPVSPYRFCQSFLYSDNKNECLAIIRDSEYVDEYATAYCAKLTFTDDKMNCFRSVVNKHFESEAVDVCLTLTFSDDKTACMVAIANKYYHPDVLPICRSHSFASEKIKCMNDNGRDWYRRPDRCLNARETLGEVQDAREALLNDDTYRADQILYRIERRLKICD